MTVHLTCFIKLTFFGAYRGRCRKAPSTCVWRTTTASLTSDTGIAASSVAFRNVSLLAWSAKVGPHLVMFYTNTVQHRIYIVQQSVLVIHELVVENLACLNLYRLMITVIIYFTYFILFLSGMYRYLEFKYN